MELHSEWTSRDETVLASVIKHYQLENFTVVVPQPEAKKKRMRRRSNSMRKSISETVPVNKLSTGESAAVRAEEMAASSEFARRQSFSGDPIRKAREWIKNEDWDNAIWAFDEMNTRKAYFANKATEDVEDFVLEIVKLGVRSSKSPVLGAARLAFAEVNFRADFVVNLLSRHEVGEPNAKKAKSTSSADMFFEASMHCFLSAFHSETADDYERRLIFVIDILVNTTTFAVDARIFSVLFGLIKEFGDGNDAVTMRVVNLLLKALKSPGKYKISSADLKMDSVVEMMRTTHSHHILRDSLRLLTAAVRVSPTSVTSHVMSVFTFMGNGLLRKDNELTLRIIEDTLEALFRAVCEEDGKTLPTEMRLRLIGVARVFAASVCDIPAHRRARMAHAIARAVKHINVWVVVGVLLEHFCARWQRSAGDANKRSAEQDAFEDFALELFVGLDPILQLSAAVDLVEFIVRLGSDNPSESAPEILDQTIFDRSKYSVPKLRHFRFVTIGLVVKILSNRKLYERLGAIDDALLYQSMLPIGKRLMTASVELGEFVDKENAAADQGSEPQTVRYWVALSSRAETVSEKLRHLMPGGVAARIITDILEDEKTDWRMREKALQLANLKLIHDGFFFSESGINEEHLERMAVVLNKWLVKERLDREKIILCQNAAFTLKLVAKRLSCRSDSSTLAETIGKCTNMVADYQTLDECMVGNALLLAGELIRSHNMRTTMVSAIPLLKTCLSILNECSLSQQSLQDSSNQPEDANGKRRRVRQQSLSGKKLGSSTLLICALTCTQRILDQFAPFVSQFIPEILVQFCRLCGRYCDSDAKASANPIERSHPLQTLTSIQHRLSLIRAALLKLEVRVIGEHFAKAVVQLSREEKPLIALFALLKSFFDQKNRVTITQIRNSLVSDVFLKGLEYRAHDRNVEDVDRIANVEQSVFSSLLAMAEVLTENTLRSVVNTLVDWAEQGLKPTATREERGRLITVFMFANSFYDSFNSLALPYFGKLIEMSVKVLNSCNATILIDPSLLLLHGKKDSMDGKEADCLVTEVIDFVGNCARQREFFTEDRAESLVVPLTNEIVNSRLGGHEKRCVPHLANTLYRISDTHPDIFQTVLDKVLLKTRNGRAKIRYRALLVVEAIFDKVGDGVAPHLPMIMPFLSELLEDENRNVEEQCDRVVRLLQSKFGENICEGFA
ncbi:BP28CT domain protein [Ancylostoma caninum]|uniref:HEAT repeat-containing protein 1 n=1 Tax=Ancylostoma caninum TaxID=29170 RepID=A0A368GY59_ANCCA|nr:BP28CT domain protein [Ancylostoma caninum]